MGIWRYPELKDQWIRFTFYAMHKIDMEALRDKDIVISKFKDIAKAYNITLEELTHIDFKHPLMDNIQTDYSEKISELLRGVVEETELMNSQIVWDHLVIAFFGETGAGKSTLVETLRMRFSLSKDKWAYGSIVGNGQSDFTKDATEYELEISGKKVTLIDVPGIEGEENKYEKIIKKALRKAHIIFYVQGKNRKPDAEIAKKIQKYLSDWSRVISIYNIRATIDTYMLESDLSSVVNDKTKKIEKEISETFKNILKDTYIDSILLQGLIAFTASKELVDHPEFGSKHKKLLNIFHDHQCAVTYSNFETLISIILKCNGDYKAIIRESGLQKVEGLRTQGKRNLNLLQDKYNQDIIDLINKIKELKRKIKGLFYNQISLIKTSINGLIETKFISLQKEIFEVIDSKSNHKESWIRSKISNCSREIEREILEAINNSLVKTQTLINKYTSDINGITPIRISIDNIKLKNINIDIKESLNKMKISSSDVTDVGAAMSGGLGVGLTVGLFVPVIGNVIGAVGGAVIGGTSAILKKTYSGNKKAKAKSEMADQIKVCISECQEQVSPILEIISKDYRTQHKIVDENLSEEVNNILNLQSQFELLINRIKY